MPEAVGVRGRREGRLACDPEPPQAPRGRAFFFAGLPPSLGLQGLGESNAFCAFSHFTDGD